VFVPHVVILLLPTSVDTLASAVDAPGSEVVEDGGLPGELVGEEAPLASALQEVEDLAKIVDPGASEALGSWQVGAVCISIRRRIDPWGRVFSYLLE
jgi:hypothetical protein